MKREVDITRRELHSSVQAVTQKLSDELAKSHDIVGKTWSDVKARLASALSEMPGTVVPTAESKEEEGRSKERHVGALASSSSRTPSKKNRSRQ